MWLFAYLYLWASISQFYNGWICFLFLQHTCQYMIFVLKHVHCWGFINTVSFIAEIAVWCYLILLKTSVGKGWIYLKRETGWGERFQTWVQSGLGNDLLDGFFWPISKNKLYEQLLNVELKSEELYWWAQRLHTSHTFIVGDNDLGEQKLREVW